MQDDDIGPISGINSGDIVVPVSGAGSASANIDMVSTKLFTCLKFYFVPTIDSGITGLFTFLIKIDSIK